MCDTRELINIHLEADTDRLGLQHSLFIRDKRAENHYSTFNLCPMPAAEVMSLREPSTGRNPLTKQAEITGRAYVKKKLSTACPALTTP